MKVLVIKTSSLGDIIHTLPALTDAAQHFPEIEFDWVVEGAFQEIPRLHSHVKKIIPIYLRKWRKNLFSAQTRQEIKIFLKTLRDTKYDLIIDAQGLAKSAWIARLAKGVSLGLDWKSARESLASIFYQRHVTVNFQQHAIVRMREIFAKALNYPLPTTAPVGLDKDRFPKPEDAPNNYVIFLHGTTWLNKKWPIEYWQALGKKIVEKDITVLLPHSNEEEYQDALRIQQNDPHIQILPKQTLTQMAGWISHARAIVAVDTGLGHLTAALGTPCVSLYGPTNPALTGTLGPNQIHLSAKFPCAPCLQKNCHYRGNIQTFPACFTTIPPETVWQSLNL
ncbi:MAG: rfaC [Gammaproteobacteria bacterium]|jgi:heptosyltransferase-1|nr:rfaC [Gammaproteobacteria bacterium]